MSKTITDTMPKSVKLKLDTRPLIAVCECGTFLRSGTREISGDHVYLIEGKKVCKKCARKWFDRNYLISEFL